MFLAFHKAGVHFTLQRHYDTNKSNITNNIWHETNSSEFANNDNNNETNKLDHSEDNNNNSNSNDSYILPVCKNCSSPDPKNIY